MALVWDQGTFGAGSSSNLSSRILANDFTLTSAAQLTSIRVWMSDGAANNNGILDNFGGTLSFAIYTNNSGAPGTLIYSSSASVAGGTLTLTDSGANESGSYDIVRADLSVAGGQTLAAGSYFVVLREGAWGSPSDDSAVWWNTSTAGTVGASGHASPTLDGTGIWSPVGADFAMQLFGGLPPVVSLFNGQTVTWNEGDGSIFLDLGSDATVTDADSANFNGGTLVATIGAGRVAGQDHMDLRLGTGLSIADGSILLANGFDIGTVALSGADNQTITFTFNASATASNINLVLRNLLFSNTGGDAPTAGTRTINYTLTDDAGASTSWTSSVLVNAVDDASVANGDSRSVYATQAVNIAVLANDSDPDGAATLHVAMINGQTVTSGDTVTLSSGATVTLLANGKIQYNAGSAFNWLTSAEKGAATGAASSYIDHFNYSVDDGATATVAVTVNGYDRGDGKLSGDAGNNTLTGTSGRDVFMFQAGGNDQASGGLGDDVFFYGASLSSQDRANGGEGSDTLVLQGRYGSSSSAQYNMGAAMMSGIETLVLMAGDDNRMVTGPFSNQHYYLRMHDGNVAAGETLLVQGSRLRAGEQLYFNGAAETDGSFKLVGGAANDVLIGGAQADWLYGGLGVDYLTGGAGNDHFVFRTTAESGFGAADFISDLAVGDVIDLREIDADVNQAGDQAFTLIGSDPFHNVAGELQVVYDTGNWWIAGDTNGDGTADLMLIVGGSATTFDFLY